MTVLPALVKRYSTLALSFALLGAVFVVAGAGNVLIEVKKLPFVTLCGAFALSLAVPMWAALRFWRVLAHFGANLPFGVCFKSTIAGQVASLLFIPLLGQVAGRQTLMAKSGVPIAANAAIAIYERLTTAFISGAGAIFGFVYIWGDQTILAVLKRLELLPITITVTGAFIVFMFFGASKFEREIRKRLICRKSLINFLEIMLFASIGYATMILIFALVFHTVALDVPVPSIIAAAAIVSFAASIPIGVGGWGLREIASVYVLGFFGVAHAEALAVAVVVGSISTVAVLLIALFSKKFRGGFPALNPNSTRKTNGLQLEKLSSWVIGVFVAVFVFFQLHVEIGASSTSVNLADPLAVLALTVVSYGAFSSRKMPQWQLLDFNYVLLVLSLMWVVGYVWGWYSFGFTQWAFTGKLLGWLVLLGYLAAGHLVVVHHGVRSIKRLVEILLSATTMVVLMGWIMKAMPSLFDALYRDNFDGFSGNRNTFALQILTVIAIGLVYTQSYKDSIYEKQRGTWMGIFLGFAFVGIIWCGSRTALVVLGLVLLISLAANLANRRLVFVALASGVIVLLLERGLSMSSIVGTTQAVMSPASSDSSRWLANVLAFQMWQESKILGVGLGGFIARSREYFSFPMVVHSTPVWILTEMGIFGICCLLYGVTKFIRHLYKFWNADLQNRALFLVLIVFAIFSLVHEVLYQRIFWFSLGLLLSGSPRSLKQDLSVKNK